VSWDNPTDRVVLGPELLKDMEDQMVRIKQNLKAAQDRQKSYADKNRTTREFKVGEHVLLKVNPKKSSLKLGSCTKLAARFVVHLRYCYSPEDATWEHEDAMQGRVPTTF
jgi:hypothetical protein